MASKPANITKTKKALFDAPTFERELRQASSKIACYRGCIQAARNTLDERFRAGGKIEYIIADFTWFIDRILCSAWQQYDWAGNDDVSLLAVGGYGRGELHPHSDIDIQILLAKNLHQRYKSNIESFLTFLWDINLEIGQSVRTIRENKQEAAKDITIATALMESRTVAGNPVLHEKVIAELGRKNIWEPKKFFAEKKAEQDSRHAKYDDIEYALEPDLKVSPGGLRDFQTIGWIAKRYFGASDFKDLVERGFLQESEYKDLIKGRNFLWRLRYGLHMLTDRKEDRLLFEHQRRLAEIFDYRDDDKSLGIEKLMQQYYRNIQTLRVLNDVLLQLFDEEIIRSREKSRIEVINSRFQIRNNYIEAVHPNVFRQTPPALLEVFVLFARNKHIEGIRASTIRLIRANRNLVDRDFRNDMRNTSLFMELLRSPYKMVARLRQMKRYGILSAYLPEFGRIVGKMQHDLFHIYTVDDHTLQVVENMRRLWHDDAGEKYPLAARLIHQLPKVELLYIAGLYHDIAKGRGGDHSELGARDAEHFCKRHHLGNWDTRLVSWLVKKHLLLSSVAQRKDIQDPEVIKDFALEVGDQTRLDYLYTLTVADINATNPKLWNTWRAALMSQLYASTKRALTQGLEKIVDKESLIKEKKASALAQLREQGFSEKQVLALWNNPSEDYFLRENVDDIVWQTTAIAAHKDNSTPLILIRNRTEHRFEGATQVFVYSRNSQFLFANIATAFDRLNMNIQDARIFNNDADESFITFMVLETSGKPIETPERIDEMRAMLEHYIGRELKPRMDHRRTSRRLKNFNRATETTLSNPDELPYSILEVLCPDRPGLLAIVANIFVEMGIVMHNAKITTLGENVEDVFFITTEDDQPLHDEAFAEALQSRIREELDAETVRKLAAY